MVQKFAKSNLASKTKQAFEDCVEKFRRQRKAAIYAPRAMSKHGLRRQIGIAQQRHSAKLVRTVQAKSIGTTVQGISESGKIRTGFHLKP